MLVPPHLQDWCVRVTHNGEIPHQLLWWVRHEPVVVATSLGRYEGALVVTRKRSSSGRLITSGSGLQGPAAFV